MLNDVQNESFAEQLREKTRHFKETGQELDYFLVCEPEWLEKQHPEEAKKVGRPCVALIGKDKAFMKCASCTSLPQFCTAPANGMAFVLLNTATTAQPCRQGYLCTVLLTFA